MEISMHTAVFKDGDENIIDEQALFAEDIAGEENEVINLIRKWLMKLLKALRRHYRCGGICLCSDE